MLENLVQILNTIQEDIAKKFENSKYLPKIQEIFEKNFEIIINYFIRCLQNTDQVKVSVKENLVTGFSQLNQIIGLEMEEIVKNIQLHNNIKILIDYLILIWQYLRVYTLIRLYQLQI